MTWSTLGLDVVVNVCGLPGVGTGHENFLFCNVHGRKVETAEPSDPPESPEPTDDDVWVEWLLAIANLPHDDHHTEHDGLIVCDICAARHMLDTYQHPDTPDHAE